MSDETQTLKKEIERLNKIIASFIDVAAMLKAENQELKKMLGDKISVDGIPEVENGINSGVDSIYKTENGINSVVDDLPKVENGINYGVESTPNIENGIKAGVESIQKVENGINYGVDGSPKVENGINSNLSPFSQKNKNDGGSNNIISDLNLPVLEINAANIRDLTQELSGNFPIRTKYEKKKSVAAQLLLLHNTGGASGDELRKAAGLSKPGWAKHFPKVRRAGFYVKAAPRKYVLTQKSKEILFKTFGGERKE